jgi:signal transduction histidine kinase
MMCSPSDVAGSSEPAFDGDVLGEGRAAGAAGPSRAELESEVERLRRAAKLQSELVAAVAHELRTPLASVMGFTELLLDRELEPAARDRYLRTINTEARRLGRLIDDLFDVQLVAGGASNLTLERFDVSVLLAQQVDLFTVVSETHSLRLAVPARPLLVKADRDRITQVVANLLSNAIKFSPEGGIVVVDAEPRERTIRISVRDAGVGIPHDQHHMVFARFFRAGAEHPLADGARSVGLGLALSREIVHAHGGSFGFDSAPGEGSTFWFELPDLCAADAVRRDETSERKRRRD